MAKQQFHKNAFVFEKAFADITAKTVLKN